MCIKACHSNMLLRGFNLLPSKFPKFITVSCNPNIPTPFVLKTIEALDFKASQLDFCEI